MDCAVYDRHFWRYYLMLSDDFYIRLKAVILNLVFAGAFLLSPMFSKDKKPLIQRFGRFLN
jgi:intracellular septation protein